MHCPALIYINYTVRTVFNEGPVEEAEYFVHCRSLGVFGESTNTLFDMLHDLKYDEQRVKYVKKK